MEFELMRIITSAKKKVTVVYNAMLTIERCILLLLSTIQCTSIY